MGRAMRFCKLNGNQTICSGEMDCCEHPDLLKKALSERKTIESSGHPEEEASKKESAHYKILVVDDQESMRNLLHQLLGSRGHQSIQAGNGIEALNLMGQNQCDAVITDILMPKMDGIALTKEIVNQYPHVPVMVITGHSKEYPAESAIAGGAREFIEKPFALDEFILRFSKMMRDQEILSQIENKREQMVFNLSKKSSQEIDSLKKEIEDLKSRLCSVYSRSW